MQPRQIFLTEILAPWFCLLTFAVPKPKKLALGYGNIAQLVEHSTENAGVVGSIPTVATFQKARSVLLRAFFVTFRALKIST